MKAYIDLVRELISKPQREDRTGVGTLSKVGNYEKFDLGLGARFPAVTTKKFAFKSCLAEQLGFLRAADSAATFRELGCNVWNANANEDPDNGKKNMWLRSPWRKGRDDMGRVYGVQWRNWEDTKISEVHDHQRYMRSGYVAEAEFVKNGKRYVLWVKRVDQIKETIKLLKADPNTRRALVTGWNPADLDKGALPPCHVIQHYVAEEMSAQEREHSYWRTVENDALFLHQSRDAALEEAQKKSWCQGGDMEKHRILDQLGVPRYKLSMTMFQRSCDVILGMPYNVAGYAIILTIMARLTGYAIGDLHYMTSDTHVYKNHIEAAKEQIGREPIAELPRLLMNPKLTTLEHIENATTRDFRLVNYSHHGPLSNATPMAI